MSETKSIELRVSVDVGYRSHSVAIGLPNGEVLEEFEIAHRPEGFQEFFTRIEKHRKAQDCGVGVAIEGYNGYARPLDSLVRSRGYRLYNINNLKLARFKEIFPGAAKKDRIDARKGLERIDGKQVRGIRNRHLAGCLPLREKANPVRLDQGKLRVAKTRVGYKDRVHRMDPGYSPGAFKVCRTERRQGC